jgi:hypothetical protein
MHNSTTYPHTENAALCSEHPRHYVWETSQLYTASGLRPHQQNECRVQDASIALPQNLPLSTRSWQYAESQSSMNLWESSRPSLNLLRKEKQSSWFSVNKCSIFSHFKTHSSAYMRTMSAKYSFYDLQISRLFCYNEGINSVRSWVQVKSH